MYWRKEPSLAFRSLFSPSRRRPTLHIRCQEECLVNSEQFLLDDLAGVKQWRVSELLRSGTLTITRGRAGRVSWTL